MIRMYPTEFEAVDETENLLFKVVCFDEACSNVEVKTLVTPESWPEISDKILTALRLIHEEKV